MNRAMDSFKYFRVPIVLIAFAAVALPQTPLNSADALSSFAESRYMLGDWGGVRPRLENFGITFSFVSVNDFLLDGRGDQANWSRVRGTVDIDFGKMEFIQGLTFHATALWQGGGNMGAYIGSIANPSSLVSANTTRLDSWWFEKSLANEKLFIRLGQFAGEDFYGVQPYGSSYIMEPLGYALGNLHAADYETYDPASTPAAELRLVPIKNLQLRTAVFSGNRNAYGDDLNGVHLRFRDNPSLAAEARYLVDPTYSEIRKTYPGSYAFGATSNLGPFYNVATNVRSSGNYLIYVMANQAVFRRDAGSSRGLDVDFAFDWSPSDVVRDYSQITGGVRYNGLIPGRRGDTLAAGVVYTRMSPSLNQALVSDGLLPFGSEKAVELNYSIKVTRWFTFQPVYQHYFDTGADPVNRGSSVAGFRTNFTL